MSQGIESMFTDMRPKQWCTGLTWSLTAVCGLSPKADQLNSIMDRQAADSYRRMLNQFASDTVTQAQRDWERDAGRLTPEMLRQAMDKLYHSSTPAAMVQQDAAMRAYWDERMAWAAAKYGPSWSAALSLDSDRDRE
jgi:hypothetical protein